MVLQWHASPITSKVASSNPDDGETDHHDIKRNIVESGVRHHNHNPLPLLQKQDSIFNYIAQIIMS